MSHGAPPPAGTTYYNLNAPSFAPPAGGYHPHMGGGAPQHGYYQPPAMQGHYQPPVVQHGGRNQDSWNAANNNRAKLDWFDQE